jgi:protein TonB
MPRFPGCEDLPTKEEKKQCADKKMLEFIYKNIKYPAIARENGVEGTVVIQFVVEKNGEITDAAIVRDIGAQCGQEALRVVSLMNQQNIKWTPGMQRGRPVRVQFNLPVKFRFLFGQLLPRKDVNAGRAARSQRTSKINRTR